MIYYHYVSVYGPLTSQTRNLVRRCIHMGLVDSTFLFCVAQNWSFLTLVKQWLRAETLGALVNGVFLVALCLSIFLEAIQRLVEPQEVRNPKLVCIVGSLGLLSNIVGLVLFHDHSHGHGGQAPAQ